MFDPFDVNDPRSYGRRSAMAMERGEGRCRRRREAADILLWVGLCSCLGALLTQMFPLAAHILGADMAATWRLFGFGVFLIAAGVLASATRPRGNRAPGEKVDSGVSKPGATTKILERVAAKVDPGFASQPA